MRPLMSVLQPSQVTPAAQLTARNVRSRQNATTPSRHRRSWLLTHCSTAPFIRRWAPHQSLPAQILLALITLLEPADCKVITAEARLIVAVSYTHLRAHETDSYLV